MRSNFVALFSFTVLLGSFANAGNSNPNRPGMAYRPVGMSASVELQSGERRIWLSLENGKLYGYEVPTVTPIPIHPPYKRIAARAWNQKFWNRLVIEDLLVSGDRAFAIGTLSGSTHHLFELGFGPETSAEIIAREVGTKEVSLTLTAFERNPETKEIVDFKLHSPVGPVLYSEIRLGKRCDLNLRGEHWSAHSLDGPVDVGGPSAIAPPTSR